MDKKYLDTRYQINAKELTENYGFKGENNYIKYIEYRSDYNNQLPQNTHISKFWYILTLVLIEKTDPTKIKKFLNYCVVNLKDYILFLSNQEIPINPENSKFGYYYTLQEFKQWYKGESENIEKLLDALKEVKQNLTDDIKNSKIRTAFPTIEEMLNSIASYEILSTSVPETPPTFTENVVVSSFDDIFKKSKEEYPKYLKDIIQKINRQRNFGKKLQRRRSNIKKKKIRSKKKKIKRSVRKFQFKKEAA